MSLRNYLVLVWVICLSYKVVTSGCEVVLVNRNVIDSFRVGQDGCTNDASVCPSPATCQSDGLCLCSKSPKIPDYRNPIIIIANGELFYADTYGCVKNEFISYGVGTLVCLFSPFQEVPYSHNEPRKEFPYDGGHDTVLNCSMRQALVKFPDNFSEMELQWFDESYVDLHVSSNKMYFKLKRSVPKLQGTIITLNLDCTVLSNPPSSSRRKECLRAKFSGTWSADTSSINEPSTKQTASDVSPKTTMTTSPKSSARSSTPGQVSSSDDDSSETIIAIAVVVPIVLLVVLVVVVWLLCKRKRGNSKRNSTGGTSGKETGTKKQFRCADSNLRGPYVYATVPARDTTQTFSSHLSPVTPDDQSVVVDVNPAYEAPDVKMKENSYPEPEYETPDVERKEISGSNSHLDLEYETPDFKRKEINGANSQPDLLYETPDVKRGEINGDNSDQVDREHETPGLKRREVNGANSYPEPAYETPDLKKRKVSSDNSYPDPGYETTDVKRKDTIKATSDAAYSTPYSDIRNEEANVGLSTPDIERIDVNGDLYALPDKNRNSKK